MAAQQLKKLNPNDIRLGEGLRFSVYDAHGTLLLRKGLVVSIPAQVERLVAQGCYIDVEEVQRERERDCSPIKQEISIYARTEDLCNKLKGIFVSLIRIPEQTEAFSKCHELAMTIRTNCKRNASGIVATLQSNSTTSYLITHQLLGATLVQMVGQLADYTDEELTSIVCASLTRDLGMGIMQTELDKIRGPLPDPLMAQVRSHPQHSVEILAKAGVADALWLAAVAQHHERIDGSGYPKGLNDQAIARGARLIAVCDAFSAMIKPRPYRDQGRARLPQVALKEIYALRGKVFDTEYSELLVKAVGIIPPGSIVKLKNNETALTVAPILNPKVAKVYTIYDRNQMPVIEPVLRDTSLPDNEIVGMCRHEECRSAQLIIKSILMKG